MKSFDGSHPHNKIPAEQEKPIVQIGISIKNTPTKYIKKCLKSCLKQKGIPIQIDVRIDGDNAASEGALRWLEQQEKKHPTLNIYKSNKCLGAYGSYQELFTKSDSKFLCQVDPDDILAPEAIHTSVQALEASPESSFAYTHCLNIDHNGCPIGMNQRQQIEFTQENLLLNFITFHLRLIRRNSYEQIGGIDTKLKYTGDYDLSLKLSEIGNVIFVNRPLYFYRVHEKSMSQTLTTQINQEVELICNEALKRRGLQKKFKIHVDTSGTTQLIPKVNKPANNQETIDKTIFYVSPEEMHGKLGV